MRVDIGRVADRLFDGFLGLPGQSHDEGAVSLDAEVVAILGKSARNVDQDPFDVVQDFLVAGFIADQQQAQAACSRNTLSVLLRNVRLGMCMTNVRHTKLVNSLAISFGARTIVCERCRRREKNFLTSGNAFCAQAISSTTWPTERLR